MKKQLLWVMILNLIALGTRAQISEPKIIPPSPESQSLEKFVDHPVDYFRGSPKIEIPIWNIAQDGAQVPISLMYHPGGVQVQEVPSNIGLGWAANVGGTISRKVNGSPDDSNVGYTRGISWLAPNCPEDAFFSGALEAFNGDRDWEPDWFTYTFPGGSGKFFFDYDGNIHQQLQTAHKIEFNPLLGSSFTITADDGVKYLFDKTETSYRSQPFNSQGQVFYISSWHLTKITVPWATSARQITFAYEPYTTVVKYPKSETWSSVNNFTSSQSIITHQSQRIKNISYLNGSVVFNYGEFRADLQGAQRLENIVIKNLEGGVIKTFELEHKYFNSAHFDNISDWVATETTVANHLLRLCLIRLKETGSNETIEKPPYQFVYESGAWLPNRIESMAVDHWGFFNGKNQNTTFIPNRITGYVDNVFPIYSTGGDREPSALHCKAGSLTKIIYPTGGYTEYNFEMHKVYPGVNVQPVLEQFTASTFIRQCDIQNANDITISNYNSSGVVVKLKLQGSFFTPNAQTCSGNQVPILPGDPNRHLAFKIFNVNDLINPVYISSGNLRIDGTNKNDEENLFLPNGTYRIKVYLGLTNTEAVNSDATINTIFVFTVSGTQQQAPLAYKPVGGLRIKEIKSYESIGSKPIHRVFDYTNLGVESGRINVIPRYSYLQKYPSGIAETYTSFSGADMFYDGVGYTIVSEFLLKDDTISTTNGKTVYEYTYPEDMVYIGGNPGDIRPIQVCFNGSFDGMFYPGSTTQFTFPYRPPISQSWRRGLLLSKTEFAYVAGNFQKRWALTNLYKDDYYGDPYVFNPSTDVRGTKVSTPVTYSPPDVLWVDHYFLPSRLVKLVQSETKQYDLTGNNPVSVIQEYHFDDLNHLQPSRIVRTKSNGEREVTLSLYPEDFANNTGSVGEMKASNIRNQPVESVTYTTDLNNGNAKIVSGQVITYYGTANVGKPASLRVLEVNNPVPVAQFKFSNKSSSGVIPAGIGETEFDIDHIDSRYSNPKLNYFYDPVSSNLTTIINSTNGYSKTYLWGYDQTVPIAEIKNAASTNDVAYTSFELSSGGNWTFTGTPVNPPDAYSPPSGVKCYLLSATVPISKSGLTPFETYTLDYWHKSDASIAVIGGTQTSISSTSGPNGWVLSTRKITGTTSITLSGVGYIDEVRLYPVSALMTSYTYDPLIGVTSVTDPNNNILYHVYDGVGRLEAVKDSNKNIIRHYKYHYKE